MLLKNFYISHFYYKYFGVSYEEIKQKDRRTTKNNVKLYKGGFFDHGVIHFGHK